MESGTSIIALTHLPSPAMQACELTFVDPSPIDCELAAQQHEQYCQALRELGAQVVTLKQNQHLPDCAFIEDTAVVLDEIAIIGSMGAASRAAEPLAIKAELSKYRPVVSLDPPARLEGGDVLRIGRTLLLGRSSRTNDAGIAALEKVAAPLGYRVIQVPVTGCLHFKTACTALPDGTLLANRRWFDASPLHDFVIIDVPEEEPFGGNVLLLGRHVLMSASHPRTADLLRGRGYSVHIVDISEFEKAEGGVTCLSILFSKQAIRKSK